MVLRLSAKKYIPAKLSFVSYTKMLWSNQFAGLFNPGCLWKESINILQFLHGSCDQRNKASETTTSSSYLDQPVLALVDLGQTARLKIFQRLINTHNFKFWVKMKSRPIRMQIFLIIIISGSSQSISQIFLQRDKSSRRGNP